MQHLGQVRDHQRIIEESGTKILAVSFGSPADVEDYRQHFELTIDIASDPSRALYAAYGMRQGSLSAVYGIAAMKQHFELRSKGYAPPPNTPKQDTLQLGGDFVIGPDGRIAFAHPSRSGEDRASIDAIVRAATEFR